MNFITTNLNRCCYEVAYSLWSPNQLLCVSAFSYAFCPASILALVDRPRQHQRWQLVLLAVWCRSLCEPLVCQPLAGNAVHKAIQPRQGMVFDVAFVQSERKFINVAA